VEVLAFDAQVLLHEVVDVLFWHPELALVHVDLHGVVVVPVPLLSLVVTVVVVFVEVCA